MKEDAPVPVLESGAVVAELETLLASKQFARSPNLAAILHYICTATLEGHAQEIKEYTVALQALKRDASFDPSRDSIVRVEVSRLRKRLSEYYRTDGESHAIHIELPESGYLPRFVHHAAGRAAVAERAATEMVAVPVLADGKPRNVWIWMAAAVTTVVALVIFLVLRGKQEPARPAAANRTSSPVGVPAAMSEMRIAAGSSMPKYEDSMGRTWTGDAFFRGGESIVRTDHRIYRTLDARLYQRARVGDFEYTIPVRPGVYELHLHFAEILHGETVDSGAEGYRRFNVSLNGRPLMMAFDIALDTGGMVNTADEKIFTGVKPLADGAVHLKFWASNDQAMLSGIELIPGAEGKMLPVRILAGQRTAFDRAQHFWGADRYFLGGRVLTRTQNIGGSTDPELFESERFGNFTYDIPVAVPGLYTAALYFAESNFGVDNFGVSNYGTGGRGNRVFDIFCNGVACIRNLDIFAEAGRPNNAVVKTFRYLRPNAQGKLDFSFVPVTDYATVRAIEVTPE